MWEMGMSVMYFLNFFFEPLLIAFWFEPSVRWRTGQLIAAWIFIADMVLGIFTGV